MPKKILVVVGGQTGSEAKGEIAGHLCQTRKVDYAVRTGSINAGHTVYYEHKKYVMQQIPVGWINPNTKLVIGAGTYVYPPLLEREVAMINAAMPDRDVRDRLFIDQRAALHTDEHHATEQSSGLHERMGSTGEGVAAAIVDKMGRRFDYQLFSQTKESQAYNVVDTVKLLNEAYDEGEQLLLEGTQGTLLDFHLGKYPFVTSRQTTAGAWATEAGLSPALDYEVVIVFRTFPIRVAGNSGPFPLETSWELLASEMNEKLAKHSQPPIVSPSALREFEEELTHQATRLGLPSRYFHLFSPEQRQTFAPELTKVHQLTLAALPEATVNELKKLFELTTVTKKLRRIARFDFTDAKYAIQLNRPTSIALTFLNYQFPELRGRTEARELSQASLDYIQELEEELGVPVHYTNCAPDAVIEL